VTATEIRPSLGARAGGAYGRLADGFWRVWDRIPLPGKALTVIALYLLLASVVPTHFVASFMAPQSGWTAALSEQIGIYVLLAIGLNVVVGQAGMLDLGYVGFWAVGGYAYAVLAAKHHWDFWYILPVAIAFAAISGLILGAPTLRLRGDYLAIVTLGFGLIISQAITNMGWDGGAQGVSSIPHPPSVKGVKQLTYGVLDFQPYWYLVLAVIFVVVFGVRRLERSRVGRAWVAIREDEDVAELMGVPTYRFRLWAFAIGASVGGIGGVMYASQANAIQPTTFSYQVSILVVAAVVIGGSGNLIGVVFGGFLVAWLPERFRNFSDYRLLVFGAALVVVMVLRPQGLIPSRRRRAELVEAAAGGGMGAPLVPPDVEGAS
jgi:branched-chain amino acid transport system permease protein